MKSVCILVVFLFAAHAQHWAPVVDENDVVVDYIWTWTESGNETRPLCSNVSGTSTPPAIAATIRQIYEEVGEQNLPPICPKEGTTWFRGNKSIEMVNCLERTIIKIKYVVEDRRPLEIQDPCKLEVGNYTWTATVDGALTFGLPINTLEWGVKHIALANKRQVVSAGEMRVANNTIYWNIASGSFMDKRSNKDEIEEYTEWIWNSSSCATRFVPVHPDRLLDFPSKIPGDYVLSKCGNETCFQGNLFLTGGICNATKTTDYNNRNCSQWPEICTECEDTPKTSVALAIWPGIALVLLLVLAIVAG